MPTPSPDIPSLTWGFKLFIFVESLWWLQLRKSDHMKVENYQRLWLAVVGAGRQHPPVLLSLTPDDAAEVPHLDDELHLHQQSVWVWCLNFRVCTETNLVDWSHCDKISIKSEIVNLRWKSHKKLDKMFSILMTFDSLCYYQEIFYLHSIFVST